MINIQLRLSVVNSEILQMQMQQYLHWLKWFCEAGGSPDEARLEQTPYPFQPH